MANTVSFLKHRSVVSGSITITYDVNLNKSGTIYNVGNLSYSRVKPTGWLFTSTWTKAQLGSTSNPPQRTSTPLSNLSHVKSINAQWVIANIPN